MGPRSPRSWAASSFEQFELSGCFKSNLGQGKQGVTALMLTERTAFASFCKSWACMEAVASAVLAETAAVLVRTSTSSRRGAYASARALVARERLYLCQKCEQLLDYQTAIGSRWPRFPGDEVYSAPVVPGVPPAWMRSEAQRRPGEHASKQSMLLANVLKQELKQEFAILLGPGL